MKLTRFEQVYILKALEKGFAVIETWKPPVGNFPHVKALLSHWKEEWGDCENDREFDFTEAEEKLIAQLLSARSISVKNLSEVHHGGVVE